MDKSYDNHVELRDFEAKEAIFPQLRAVIKVNLNLNELCDELCEKHNISPTPFKKWVNQQVPSILHVEEDDVEDDIDDEETGEED